MFVKLQANKRVSGVVSRKKAIHVYTDSCYTLLIFILSQVTRVFTLFRTANKADAEGSTQDDNRTGAARGEAWSRERADMEAAYFIGKHFDTSRPFEQDQLFCYITGAELDTHSAMRSSGRLDRTTFHYDNALRPSLDTIFPFHMLPNGECVSVSQGILSLFICAIILNLEIS